MASALLGEQRLAEAEADVALLDAVRLDARLEQDRAQVGGLVVDPGGADRLALQVGRRRGSSAWGSDMIEVSGTCTSAATDFTRSPLSRATEHLRLVGDRQVDAPGRQLLEQRRRVGGLADLHVQPRPLEVAARLGGVDARRGRRSGRSRASARSSLLPPGSSTSSFSPQAASASAATAQSSEQRHFLMPGTPFGSRGWPGARRASRARTARRPSG